MILTYILIGMLFAIFVELLADYLKSIGTWPFDPAEDPWNWMVRILIIFLWPIAIVIFIRGYIKGYRKSGSNWA